MFRQSLFLIALACGLAHGAVFAENKDAKAFSLFSVVTFKNQGCRSESGTTGSGVNRNGTCYTSTECTDKGGTASGNCASGFGVCCLFVSDTGTATVSENCTYLQNPSFPSVYSSTSSVTYTVEKCATDVCALRMDFESMTLLGPASTLEPDNGYNCQDTFKVTGGSGLTTPVICGKNQGAHIYMDMGNSASDTAKIEFAFSSTSSTVRTWEIKLTQIPCNSPSRPFDTGCLQYYTGLTGRLETFNFQETSTSAQMHLATQHYTICVRPAEGYCCLRLTLCTDTRSWSIDNTANAKIDTNCSEDYIGIVGVQDECNTDTNAVIHSRLCGINFNLLDAKAVDGPSVCTCSRPFNIEVTTDATLDTAPAAGTEQRGVCLNYQQVPCVQGQ